METLGLEEPCSVLYDRRLTGNGFNTATDYVTTTRFKKYKPKHISKADQYEYCYFDNDYSTSNIDPIMFGKECAPTNALFHAVPFISNVYENKDYESTRTAPHNKCIVKIDKDHTGLEQQQKFWDKFSEMNCEMQVEELNLKIIELTNLLQTCKATLANLLAEFDRLRQYKMANDTKIIDKQQQLRECRHHLNVLIEEYQVLDLDFKRVESRFNQLSGDCLTRTRELKMRLENCTRHKNKYNAQKEDLERDLSILTTKYRNLENILIVKSTALDNLKKQLDNALKFLEELKSKFFELQKMKKACLVNFAECKKSLQECTNSLAQTKQSIIDTVNAHIKCMEELSKCKSELKACEDARKVLQDQVDKLLDIKNTKTDQYTRCLAQVDWTIKYNEQLEIYLESLRKRKIQCEKTMQHVGQKQDDIDALLREQQRQDKLNSMYTTFLNNVDFQLQTSADDLEGICMNNETAPPPPKPPRQPPPDNGAFLK